MTETELVNFRPYKEIAIKYAAKEKNQTLNFHSFPIPGIVYPPVFILATHNYIVSALLLTPIYLITLIVTANFPLILILKQAWQEQ